jgi:hypothetical protein
MKQILTTTAFCFLALLIAAQSGKQKLGFIPYADPTTDKSGYRKMAYDYLYEAATRIFINTQRFEVLDRSKFNILKIEKNFTKGDDFINSELVAQGKALAADVLTVAKLTALVVSETEDKKAWTAFFTVEFKQIDVETSKALNAHQLKGEIKNDIVNIGGKVIGNPMRARSPEQAISTIVSKMEEDLTQWICENFPVKMEILNKDTHAKILYARGGRNIGLTLKSDMCLRRSFKLPTGDPMVETIAELKFTKTDGVGDTTTKFELKNKKDWDKVMAAFSAYPDEIFVMECVSGRSLIGNILGK